MLNIRTLAAGAALSILMAASVSAQTTPPTTTQTPGTTAPAAAPKAGAPVTPPATAPAATAPAPKATAPAPGAAAPGTVPPTAKTKKAAVPKGERTPESLACSKEADEKNIHGKKKAGDPTSVSRSSFMKKCVADAMKKNGTTPVKTKG